jgi:hypothetical protein
MTWLIYLIVFVTVIAFGGILLIANFTSPQSKEGQLISINLIYFFLSIFVSLAGSTTLVLYWLSNLRLSLQRKSSVEAVHRPKTLLRRSARQAILFSLVVTAIGILRALNFANPLNIVLIISAAALIEVYFFGH